MAHNGLYSLSSVECLMHRCADLGYEIVEIAEGSLGYGHMILLAPNDDYMNVEITEVYLNEWSSGHKIRKFSKISKRIQNLIDGKDVSE